MQDSWPRFQLRPIDVYLVIRSIARGWRFMGAYKCIWRNQDQFHKISELILNYYESSKSFYNESQGSHTHKPQSYKFLYFSFDPE